MTRDEILLRYRERLVGASVRFLRLADLSVAEAMALLTARGFERMWRPVSAERAADGRAQWLRNDGSVTTDPQASDLLQRWVFAHADHGLVEVFLEPLSGSRIVPAEAPCARKFVLYRSAVPLRPWPTSGNMGDGQDRREAQEDLAISFANRVFGVSDWGGFVPKGVRSRDGMVFDPDDLAKSHRLAAEVKGERSVVRLRA